MEFDPGFQGLHAPQAKQQLPPPPPQETKLKKLVYKPHATLPLPSKHSAALDFLSSSGTFVAKYATVFELSAHVLMANVRSQSGNLCASCSNDWLASNPRGVSSTLISVLAPQPELPATV
jgi:hypothetical protein